jgi:hypothetical protein
MFLALESHITANLEASAKVRGRWTKDMLNIISLTWDTTIARAWKSLAVMLKTTSRVLLWTQTMYRIASSQLLIVGEVGTLGREKQPVLCTCAPREELKSNSTET